MGQILRVEWGSFLLRIVCGLIFFVHGWDKLSRGMDHVSGWFVSVGLPAMMAYFVTLLELAGGLLLIVGLTTRLMAGSFSLLMIGAIVTVKWRDGFLGDSHTTGYEYNVVLLAVTIYLLLAGSKLYALDNFWAGGHKK